MKYFLYKQIFLSTEEQLIYTIPEYLTKFTFGCKFENKNNLDETYINFKIINKENKILFQYKNITIDELNNKLSEVQTLEVDSKIYASCNNNSNVFFTLFLILHEDRPSSINIERPYIISPEENADIRLTDITVECSQFKDLTGRDIHEKTEYKITKYASGIGTILNNIINEPVTTFKISDITQLENYQEYYLFVRYHGQQAISPYSFCRKIRVIKEFKFRYKFDTTLYGGNNNQISLGFYLPNIGLDSQIKVDWGDNHETIFPPKTLFDGNNSNHTYSQTGTYVVTISAEFLPIHIDNDYFKLNLIEVLDPIPPIIEETQSGIKLIDKIKFNNFPNLSTLPAKFLQNNYQATSLEECFSNNIKLKSVPEKLFYGLKNIINCNSLFENCSIETYPSDLFEYLINLKTCIKTFYNSRILNIPDNLFIFNKYLEDVTSCFQDTQIFDLNANIFKNNIKLKRLKSCFENCINLENIPLEFFKNNININNIDSLFRNCRSLQLIPEDLFKETINIQSAKNTFENCISLREIPENLFRNISTPTTFDFCFSGCTGILSIPDFVFNKKASSCIGTFKDCSNIIVISNNTFDHCQDIISVESCFENCTSLRSFSNKLFLYTSSIQSFKNCFKNTAIQELPDNFFIQTLNTLTFESCFEDCYYLKNIPGNIFISSYSAVSFKNCFKNCGSKLEETEFINLDGDLFKKSINAIDFSGCFSNSKIESIPFDLFQENNKIQNLNNCFEKTKINSIPTNFFVTNTKIKTISSCFKDCNLLTIIPGSLFTNLILLEDISDCFNGCSGLTNVTNTLFESNTNLRTVKNLFKDCSNLSEIKSGLFNNNLNIIDFSGCFQNCIRAKINNPFTISENIDIFSNRREQLHFDNTFENVADELEEEMSFPEIWNYTFNSSPTTEATFRKTKNIDYILNYNLIPENWK